MPRRVRRPAAAVAWQAWPLQKVISGGQTGADQGALDAARWLGYVTGGWAPLGWRTELGPMPWLAEFGLVEAPTADYAMRTALNISDADGTLVFGDLTSPGSALTVRTCRRRSKPWRAVSVNWPLGDVAEAGRFKISQGEIFDVRQWIIHHQIRVLNCAGNRETTKVGMHIATERFCREAFLRPVPGAKRPED